MRALAFVFGDLETGELLTAHVRKEGNTTQMFYAAASVDEIVTCARDLNPLNAEEVLAGLRELSAQPDSEGVQVPEGFSTVAEWRRHQAKLYGLRPDAPYRHPRPLRIESQEVA